MQRRGSGRRAVPVTPQQSARDSVRCLVVHEDAERRAFLASAWVFFRPGFEVITATDLDSALEWVASAPPDVVALGSSLGPDAQESIIRACEKPPDVGPCVVIAEADPASREAPHIGRDVPVLTLRDAFDLAEVIDVGREAAMLVSLGAQAEIVVLHRDPETTEAKANS